MERIELTDETLEQLRVAIREEVKKDLNKELPCIIKSMAFKIIGTLLNFPLTVKQVSILTKRKIKTVHKMCDSKQIPFSKVGKTIYINIRDINRELILEDDQDESLYLE